MKKCYLAALAIALVLGPAAETSAQKTKTTCGSDVQVTVTIAGTDGAPNGFALVSDGGGPYLNSPRGSDKITAIFQVDNCTHDFTMNLNFSKRSMWALLVDADGNPFTRRGNFFNFDRVHSVPLTEGGDGGYEAFCAQGVVLDANGRPVKNPDGSYQDNYGGCGTDEFGNYVVRAGGVSLDPDERLNFNISPIDRPNLCPDPENPSCESSRVRVYHPAADVWILRPLAPASSAYRVWKSGVYVFMGYQTVPFEITVTRP